MCILHNHQNYVIAIIDKKKDSVKDQDWTRIRTQHSAVEGRDLQQEMITIVLLLGNPEADGVASTASDILAQGVTLITMEKVDSKGTSGEYEGGYGELCSSLNQLIM